MTDNYQRPAALLTHPFMVVALVMLIVNDHYLKARHGGPITGKLSDIAGLVLFPVLMMSLLEVGAWLVRIDLPHRTSALMVIALATGTGFTLIQLMPAVTDLYRASVELTSFGPASVTPDGTDLLTLPAVATGNALLVYRRRRTSSAVAHCGQRTLGDNSSSLTLMSSAGFAGFRARAREAR